MTKATSFAAKTLVPVLLLISGCKVQIEVPKGGHVTSESSAYICHEGERCILEVNDTEFAEAFIAVPNQGYKFDGWKNVKAGLCGDVKSACELTTVNFKGNDALLSVLYSDDKFRLVPIFSQNNSGSPQAPMSTAYNPVYWSNLEKDIQAEKYTGNSYMYSSLPSSENCDPGVLTKNAQNRAMRALNEVRGLHLLPAVKRDSFYEAESQSGALILNANDYLTHNPLPVDKCYSELGYQALSTSNAGKNWSDSNDDPARDLLGWVHDRNNVSTLMAVGHRRWALYPKLGYFSYGQVKGESVLKAHGFGGDSGLESGNLPEFVAYPYLTYPYTLALKTENPTPWSISLSPKFYEDYNFGYFANAKVRVTEAESGRELKVRDLYTDNKRYGTPNLLSWLVDGYKYDTKYFVTIDNIVYPDGNIDSVEYYVYLDYYNIFNVNFPLEAGDSGTSNTLRGSFTNSNDNDSYKVFLSGNKRIAGKNNQYSNQAFFVLVYDQEKNLVKSSDVAFNHYFSEGEYTIVVSLCDENGLCYQNVKNYTVNINRP
ncbi:MAG: hypothetical protein V7720_00645 [Halioglobus sp.]